MPESDTPQNEVDELARIFEGELNAWRMLKTARFIVARFSDVEALAGEVAYFEGFIDQMEGYPEPKNHHLYNAKFFWSFDRYAIICRQEFERRVGLVLEALRTDGGESPKSLL